MSITSQRQKAVDFAMPYMNTGKICIICKTGHDLPDLFGYDFDLNSGLTI